MWLFDDSILAPTLPRRNRFRGAARDWRGEMEHGATQSGGRGRMQRFASWSGRWPEQEDCLVGAPPQAPLPRRAGLERAGRGNRKLSLLFARPLIRGLSEAESSAAPAAPCGSVLTKNRSAEEIGAEAGKPNGRSVSGAMGLIGVSWPARKRNSDELNPSANAPGFEVLPMLPVLPVPVANGQ